MFRDKIIKFNRLLLCVNYTPVIRNVNVLSVIQWTISRRAGVGNILYKGWPNKGRSVYRLDIGGDPCSGFR